MTRRNWQDGMEIVYEDLSKVAPAIERGIFDRHLFQLMQQQEDAFFNDSFLVEYASPTSITVRAGTGFQTDDTQVSPEPEKRLIYRETQSSHNISTPDGSLDRIDLVVVKAALTDEITGTRKFKDAATSVISSENMVLQRDWQAEIEFVNGTAAGSPVAPSTPAGYLKIAEIYVNAGTGLSGAGDVTDTRSKMPVAGDIQIDTAAYSRVTQGGSTLLSTILSEMDALLKNGYQEYTDIDDLAAHPANPAADKVRYYVKGGVPYIKNSTGAITPVGSGGGGGGGGAEWYEPSGYAPQKIEEYDREVYMFPKGGDQKLILSIKVPQTFITGRQIKMFLGAYSPASSGTIDLHSKATLIRVDLDPVDDNTNQHSPNVIAKTNTVAKQYRLFEFEITDSSGQINGIDVDAGDVIEIELYRDTDTDTEDLRVIGSSMQLSFA